MKKSGIKSILAIETLECIICASMSAFHSNPLSGAEDIGLSNGEQCDNVEPMETSGTEENTGKNSSSEERSPHCLRATKSFQPKRVSELPPLESESDSDDENNLNCAILNDSFLLTPSKCIEDLGSTTKVTCITPMDKENASEKPARKKLEDKLLAVSNPNQLAPPKRVPLLDRSQLEKQFTIFCQTDSKPTKTGDSGISSTASSVLSAGEHNTESDLKDAVEQKTQSPTNKDCPEINEKNKQVFVTPREKIALNPSRGTISRILTSTATRGSRSTLENEFKSQKILFATPLATGVARPPVSANDSLSLSLVDTPIKSKERPLSPIVEQPRITTVAKVKISPKKTAPDRHSSPEPPPVQKPLRKDLTPELSEPGKPETAKHVLTINGKDYQIIKKLGSGGSSSVFLAKQIGTGVECALKLVNLEGDSNLVEGYLNETKLLAKLQGNENVVTLYDYMHTPKSNQLFLVMEKGDSDLHKMLQSFQKDIPLYTLMQIWYQMVQCVHYIHEHGVIHLDLKPANFLMVKGRLKLIDFGIASNIAFDSTSIMKFSQAGTFNYISPEALIDTSTEGNTGNSQPRIRMSKKSDIWSLGCILYLLLYKKTPFSHVKNIYNKVNIITNPNTVIDYPSLPNYYPSMLLEMLQRCLRYDPKSRASTADLLGYPFEMVIPIGK
ncbi:dual specificity protein kinase Ttk isoform X2 [Wyeomyia smithii]|uniref:dual specificity protein kinase Ttk isoform X2 n=1 Tax=Wyeomyia smithii TaxID=174621 RepID=UPI002467CAEB|nr:dual specificity protein kinase Ttk isoform X2 [Wyeomyia smithii]